MHSRTRPFKNPKINPLFSSANETIFNMCYQENIPFLPLRPIKSRQFTQTSTVHKKNMDYDGLYVVQSESRSRAVIMLIKIFTWYVCIKSKEFNISTNIFGTGVCRQIAIHGSEHKQI